MAKTLTLLFAFILAANIFQVSAYAQATFSPKTDFTTGAASEPSSIKTGDINGDGLQDLIAATYTSSNVSVFLNTTTPGALTPTFSARTDFTTGNGPYYVSIADLNGDGKPDLVTANYLGANLSVFFNTTPTNASTPTFSARTDFSLGFNPYSVTIGDLNGDGKPDLVATNVFGSNVSVLFNTTTTGNAAPTFSAKTDFTTATNPDDVSIADLNGDGKPDLAVATQGSTNVSVLFNTTPTGNATPTFSAKTDFTVGNISFSVSIGDINGDGKPDMAIANTGSNTGSVLLNTTTTGAATPTFSAKTDFTTGNSPNSLVVRDINGDGKPDMAVSNQGDASVSIFLNTTTPGASTPAFTTKQDFTTGSQPWKISIADFNGDGKPDLASANYDGNNVSVLLNTMTLGVTPASYSAKTDFTTGTNPWSVSLGDFNGDGKPDMAAANSGANSVSVLLNTTSTGNSTPTFSARTDFTTGTSPYSVGIGDLNGDGKPDMATANNFSDNVSVFLNTTTPGASTPTFTARTDFTSISTSPSSVSIGDLNGDGKPDMAVTNQTGSVSVLLNTTAPGASTPTFTARTDFTAGNFPNSVSLVDFNGDGKRDMAVVNGGSSVDVSVFLNTTTPGALTPTFAPKIEFTGGGFVSNSISVGDLNGDGKPDMAAVIEFSNSVSVFLNTTTPGASTPSFSANTDFTTGDGPRSVSIRDLNGDGKLDLATANNSGNSVSVLLNTTTPGASTPTFAPKTDFTTGAQSYSIAIGDINGDGKPDLATANPVANTVSVFHNTATLPLPVELASFTSSVNINNVTLNWSTVQEQNNKGFEIERNSFGIGWKKIGYVEGHGTTNTQQNYSFKDNSLNTGRYSYRLKQIDYNGNFEYYELSNEVAIGVPSRYLLAQNYPNPFNPVSIINYQISINSFVTLKVYDLAGKEVASLVNEVKDAGYYTVTFDAKNLSSGTYFYKLSTDKFSDVKKMVVVK